MAFLQPRPQAQALVRERADAIALARRHWLAGEPARPGQHAPAGIDSAITRSWQRCLEQGRRPGQRIVFDPVPQPRQRAAAERQRPLREASEPVLAQLARAIAGTRYFAMLTDAQGVVIATAALAADAPRAALDIARVGVDLSEAAVGTTAIGLALAEHRTVWLHRAEHFFDDTSLYTCAGAPIFDADGRCAGMLDLTGVDVAERPELQHLAQQAAGAIGQGLLRSLPAALWLQINWPGGLGPPWADDESGPPSRDGLLALDADGQVLGANATARQLLPLRAGAGSHASELLAVPVGLLFDAAARHPQPVELPLWSGLRLQARAWRPEHGRLRMPAAQPAPPRLRELQGRLIEQAVRDAHGNVAEAARALGVSRATVYRQLGAARPRR
ncbi:GAF domain-containing protein [Xenophilus arseniciresistens]|uniref:GAF domain-containing protein n=1 Tax=Xenophilus arseniciresistens TaxID=1283306 RepID=A0AAE3T1B2_9BURK|nr:helix-turn-helix domain-containing protein [Xenophilus arseniciresistens]MDA7417187.1 GAF domain-containing protein [Xenophilus arseniciresistens]